VGLTPYPFAALVRRMFRELDERRGIFDLPLRRAVLGHPCDLSVSVHGQPASTPFGPAAGPHTQLAQNIVLSWLAGGRVLELKTVQVRDDLVIPRPCIDMATVGYNIEWSQELRLEESLDEYVKGVFLLRLLRASGRVPVAPGFDDTVFDVSAGYDLAGLQSPRVEAFLRGMADARPVIDRLRREVPDEYASLRDVDVPARLAGSATLSTFHGCPPGEIVGMAQHLMRAHGLHTVVKLNPMLLGPADTRALLRDALGYDELRVPDRAFANDTTWDQMLDIVGRLREDADRLGVGFGIKLTNTLIVENHRTFFPASEREMYLSGPPLHVLAVELLRRVRRALGAELPISFSAGVDAQNFADTVALGLVPVTVCSDLLQPGGYGRAFAYFQHLRDRMQARDVGSLGDYVLTAFDHAARALDAVPLDDDVRARALAALERRGDGGTTGQPSPSGTGGSSRGLPAASGQPPAASFRNIVGEEAYLRWQREAARLNVETYAAAVVRDPRYAAAAHRRTPRKIGRHLRLFDCLTCDKCIPVCPNDAIFTFVLPRSEWVRVILLPHGLSWIRREDGVLRIAEKHQIGIFADFCNECGNCDVFCPEDGGPYLLKPLVFGSAAAWERARPRDGFFVAREDGHEVVLGRFRTREFRLDVLEHEVRYRGEGFDVSFDEDDPEGTIRGEAARGVEVELTYYQIMHALARALYATDAVNYVNCLRGR
jgi:putative selenate reductase